jgi:membrane associated rhomboid family serine protease
LRSGSGGRTLPFVTAQLTKAGEAKSEIVGELRAHATILGGFVGLLWVVHFVNALLGGALVFFGVHPRSLLGLLGILFAPFLHANFAHLLANTMPLLVLGWFVMLRRKRDFFIVSALSALVGGLGTWLVGQAASVHVGASVLVFGFLGHLLSRGIFERRFWPIVGSVVVFLLYGGALFGVLPGQTGISWQGHLFGFLGGVLAARLLKRSGAPASQAGAPLRAPARVRIDAPAERAAIPASHDEADVDDELARIRRSMR